MAVFAGLAVAATLAISGTQQITWNAVEGCPSPTELERRTERFLGAKLAAYPRSLIVSARVEPGVGGGHVLELSIVVDGYREHHSVLAVDCERLASDAALLIASALDPFARGPDEAALQARDLARPFDRRPPIQRPHPRDRGEPVVQRPANSEPAPEAPRPPQALRPPRLASAPSSLDLDLDLDLDSDQARERDVGPRPELRGFLGSAGFGFAGVFPSPAGGVALEGGVERGRLRWQLGAQGWLGGRFRADTNEVGANLNAWTGSTAVCFVPSVARVQFPLCATIGAGAMIATAVGTTQAKTSVQPWVFAGADLRVSWTPRPAVGLHAGLAVLPALARPSWTVSNPDASFRLPAVTGLVRLGVEWRA